MQTTPLVVDGVMYLTTPENAVYALDAATGNVFWTYQHDVSETLALCCGKQSRGVAVRGDRLYLTTMDAHLIALDAPTGTELWDRTIADHLAGYSMTAAPLVVNDLVITGTGGGEFGIRGWVDAYDAETGERRWRAYTIPAPGEPNHETWAGDSWRTGGASTWMTGSYDPALNLIFWGSAIPDLTGTARSERATTCIRTASSPSTPTPGKSSGTSSSPPTTSTTGMPVRFGARRFRGQRPDHQGDSLGQPERLLLRPRPGDRPIPAREGVRDADLGAGSRRQRSPDPGPDMEPSPEGRLVFPDVTGASNWWSPSYSPMTGLFYTMAYDGAATYFTADTEYEAGKLFVGGSYTRDVPADTYVSAVRAITR